MIGHVVLCALASAFGSDGAQAEEVTFAAPAPGAVGANACQLGVAPTSRVWAPVPAVGALTYACPFSSDAVQSQRKFWARWSSVVQLFLVVHADACGARRRRVRVWCES